MKYINQEHALTVLKSLVEIPSYVGRSNPQSEQGMAVYLEKYIKENLKDYTVTKLPFDKDRYNLICTTGDNQLLYACHMDTISVEDKKQLSVKADGDKIRGVGTKDMKGGIVSMLLALLELQDMGIKSNAGIVFYGDEEYTQKGMRKLVENVSMIPKPKLIISPESRFNIGYGSRGVCVIKLTIKGKSAHSARPHLGVDAVKLFYKVYLKLNKAMSQKTRLGKTDITITEINGGSTQTNVIPDSCKGVISIRLAQPEVTSQEISKIIKEVVVNDGGQLDDLIILNDYRPHISPKKALKPLANAIKRSELPVDYADPKIAGYNDAVLLAKALDVPIANFGPYGEGNHTSDEYVSLKSIVDTAKVYLNLMNSMR